MIFPSKKCPFQKTPLLSSSCEIWNIWLSFNPFSIQIFTHIHHQPPNPPVSSVFPTGCCLLGSTLLSEGLDLESPFWNLSLITLRSNTTFVHIPARYHFNCPFYKPSGPNLVYMTRTGWWGWMSWAAVWSSADFNVMAKFMLGAW